MITLTCKCGKETTTFKHLSANDFPNGYRTECCRQALKDAPRIEVDEIDSSKKSPEPKKRGRKPKA